MSHYPAQKTPVLSGKRYICQLPPDLAASQKALFEMHPHPPRSRVMSDILCLGMAEVQRTQVGGHLVQSLSQPELRQPIYLLTGPFSAFHKLLYQHHLALERAGAKGGESHLNNTAGYQLGDSASTK